VVAVVSLLVLVVAQGSGGKPGASQGATASPPSDGTGGNSGAPDDPDGAPDDTDAAPGGPTAGAPPDSLPGETAEEYRWRAEADDLRRQARDVLEGLLDSGTSAADPAFQAELQRVAELLDDEALADALRQAARAADLGDIEPADPPASGGATTAVALVGALGGMITAAAGLLTAWVSWRKAARG
jgi:hypothetical protein